ncbi:hypothetical protein HZC21_02075 [Candidatus Peregrinibacteria bacterium]|nr:hypothetical protein [Candidatus Peregrinibacteria bacterium]
MNKKYIMTALLFLVIVFAGIWVYWNKNRYNVDLNLTPEQKLEYEQKVSEMNKRIREIISRDKPDIDLFIEKARYQEYLGRYGDAIDTLLESFKYYENTSVGWNNIAKLYDKVGDYKSAILFYNKLINTFNLYRYYLEVAWDYYRLGEIEIAKEAYGRYAQFEHNREEELYKLLFTNKSL